LQRAKESVDCLNSVISYINFRYCVFTEKSIKLSFTKEILLLSVTTAYTGMEHAECVIMWQCRALFGMSALGQECDSISLQTLLE